MLFLIIYSALNLDQPLYADVLRLLQITKGEESKWLISANYYFKQYFKFIWFIYFKQYQPNTNELNLIILDILFHNGKIF